MRFSRTRVALSLLVATGLTAGACHSEPKPAANEAAASVIAEGTSSLIALEVATVPPERLPQGVVIVVKDASGRANQSTPMYLASNHGGWNPGLAAQVMTPRSDGRWQIVLPRATSETRLEFKFTLGSWESVELSASGEDNVPNRTLPDVNEATYANGTQPVFEFVVPGFKAGGSAAAQDDRYRPLAVTGEMRRVEVVGGGGGAERAIRDLLVWLPPGYFDPANKDMKYPVLYLMDGQNLFEKHDRIASEWQVDETATRLIAEGAMRPTIIVGVPHAGAARSREYAPLTAIASAPAGGEAFEAWMLSEVMPRVTTSLRVSTTKEDTGIGGASLGGAISLHMATRHPDLFGAVLIESLAPLRASAADWQARIDAASLAGTRVFIGVGGREWGEDESNAAGNAAMVALSRSLEAALRSRGATDETLRFVLEPHAMHNEGAWAGRLPGALSFLFPPGATVESGQ